MKKLFAKHLIGGAKVKLADSTDALNIGEVGHFTNECGVTSIIIGTENGNIGVFFDNDKVFLYKVLGKKVIEAEQDILYPLYRRIVETLVSTKKLHLQRRLSCC
jgi:hypothetical protein